MRTRLPFCVTATIDPALFNAASGQGCLHLWHGKYSQWVHTNPPLPNYKKITIEDKSTAMNLKKIQPTEARVVWKSAATHISSPVKFETNSTKYHCCRPTRTVRGTTTPSPVRAGTHCTVAGNLFVVSRTPLLDHYLPCIEPEPGSIDTQTIAAIETGQRLIGRWMTWSLFGCCFQSTVFRLWLERVLPLF